MTYRIPDSIYGALGRALDEARGAVEVGTERVEDMAGVFKSHTRKVTDKVNEGLDFLDEVFELLEPTGAVESEKSDVPWETPGPWQDAVDNLFKPQEKEKTERERMVREILEATEQWTPQMLSVCSDSQIRTLHSHYVRWGQP